MGSSSSQSVAWPKPAHERTWKNAGALLLWLLAGIVPFLPFASDTSPWDAVTLRVSGNQGNWWHVLVGAPFFLAYPIIWLRLRPLFSDNALTSTGRRIICSIAGLSIVGTVLVEAPFLLHLAGTSQWQRLVVLGLGFGIILVSTVILFLRRRYISHDSACLAGLDTAYLANLALCLIVYSDAPGNMASKAGWLVSIVLVWPIAIELASHLFKTSGTKVGHLMPRS